MPTHEKCNQTWTGFAREHCCVCCRTFNSQYAGDKHRTGDWEPNTVNPRRCLTTEEMVKRGMFERDGVWYGSADSREAHFTRTGQISEPAEPSRHSD